MTAHETKIVNLAFNELDRMTKSIQIKDSMLGTKDLKIELLTRTEQLRAEQLILTNQDLMKCQAENKKLTRKVLIWQIVSVSGVIATAVLLR